MRARGADYDDTLTFRRRSKHSLRGETLDFCHVADAEASYAQFVEQRAARGRSPAHLRFRVGIPGDFDMALFALGPRAALLGNRCSNRPSNRPSRRAPTGATSRLGAPGGGTAPTR
jgi:hypothetical protein